MRGWNRDSSQTSHYGSRIVTKGCGYIGIGAGTYLNPTGIKCEQDTVILIHNMKCGLFGKAFASGKYLHFIAIEFENPACSIPSSGNMQIKSRIFTAEIGFLLSREV